MLTIYLHNQLFFSYHGLHDEERILGGEFELNMEVKFEESVNVITDIGDSLNYADLYIIVKRQMSAPSSLLETVVMLIGEEVHQKFSYIKEITISLKKNHPPITQMQGSVGIRWHKKY